MRAGSRPKIGFMSGMNLCASEAGTTKSLGRLSAGKKEAGMADRSEIETMFAFIDADEGRSLVVNQE
jgi:hypothetical protein